MSSSYAPRLNAGFKAAQYVIQTHWVEVTEEMPFKDVLEPSFWVHVAQYMRRGDEIVIDARDLSYTAKLKVIEVGELFAKVALISKIDLIAKSEDISALSVESVNGKFRVRRGKDVMKADLATRKDAERWISDYASESKAA